MRYFTDSPYEKMMMQVSSGGQDYNPAPQPDKKNVEKREKIVIRNPKQNKKGVQNE